MRGSVMLILTQAAGIALSYYRLMRWPLSMLGLSKSHRLRSLLLKHWLNYLPYQIVPSWGYLPNQMARTTIHPPPTTTAEEGLVVRERAIAAASTISVVSARSTATRTANGLMSVVLLRPLTHPPLHRRRVGLLSCTTPIFTVWESHAMMRGMGRGAVPKLDTAGRAPYIVTLTVRGCQIVMSVPEMVLLPHRQNLLALLL
mmetsp:Transcript_25902/g.46941  ORF Transcript_25902/g.46941 Transcript_25902/m.46941 type:complete len:201 (+) Transcript_25902:1337-1939(+)